MNEPTHDPGRQRVSDSERHQVVEALQQAAGDGRLDLEELEERLEAAWSARTYADLVPILIDLPYDAPSPPGQPRPPGPRRAPGPQSPMVQPGAGVHGPAWVPPPESTSLGFVNEHKRTGVWRVPPAHTATAVLGSVLLDVREAIFEAREVTITANAVLGSVKIVVDVETRVVVQGTPVLGGFSGCVDEAAPRLHADSPLVRLTGVALLGDVSVVRRHGLGDPRQLRRRRG